MSQGIDLVAGGRNKRVHRTAPKSKNPYIKLLVKVISISQLGVAYAGLKTNVLGCFEVLNVG